MIEKSEKSRVTSGGLLGALVAKGLLGEGQFLTALDSILQFSEDLLVDIPKFWDFLAQVDTAVFLAFLNIVLGW